MKMERNLSAIKHVIRQTLNAFPTIEWVLLVSGWLVLAITLSPSISSDGSVRLTALLEICRSLEIPKSKFSILQPVLSLPLVFLAKVFGGWVETYVSYFNLIIFYFFSVVIYAPLKSLFNSAIARSFLLVLISASMFPHHLQHYYGEVLTALLLGYGFFCYKCHPVISVAAIALAVVNTPALLPALGGAAFIRVLRKNRNGYLFVAFVVSGFIILCEMILKYGSPMNNAYLSAAEAGFRTILPYSGLPGFSYPLFFGVLSIIFSFGKGLVFFIPGILLPLSKQVRSRLSDMDLPWDAAFVFTFVSIATYGMWWAWYGGGFWGPRFFLFLSVPASFFIALIVNEKCYQGKAWFALKLLLVILSFYVATNGYIYGQSNMEICWAENFKLEFLCWYVPEFSALWRPFVVGFQVDQSHLPKVFFALWQGLVLLFFIIKMFFGFVDKHFNTYQNSML